MTGPINSTKLDGVIINGFNDKRVFICSGTTTADGAYLGLSGMNCDENNPPKGSFYLTAKDGNTSTSNVSTLTGKPDGTLTWYTKPAGASEGTTSYIATQNWTDSQYLKLSGGTMKGSISVSNISSTNIVEEIIKRDDDSGKILLCGGSAWDKGSYISLTGIDYDPPDTQNARKGQFRIVAKNGTSTSSLTGSPTGRLTWYTSTGEKDIVRSVNNQVANENGNVDIDLSSYVT